MQDNDEETNPGGWGVPTSPFAATSASSGNLRDASETAADSPDPAITEGDDGSAASTTVTGTDAAAPAPTVVTTAGSPLVFNLVWDSSVSSAPAGFMTDVIAAAQYLESQLTNAVTINIDVGYGEIDGNPLQSGDLGESESIPTNVSYADLIAALTKTDSMDATDQSVLASLPAASPVEGNFFVTPAQAKALGLAPADGASIDGEVGFAPASKFTYGLTNTTGTVAAGTFDMFGAAAHELTEVMGRILLVGSVRLAPTPDYSLLDLLHYSAPGVRDFTQSTPGYFSVDGGATNLDDFNSAATGDAGDWASSVTDDAFDASGTPGVLHSVTSNDLTELDAIGWNLAGSSAPERLLDWTGAGDTDFANAANWDDTTDDLNPAVAAPGALDLASIANGGSITGSGTVYLLNLAGANTVAGTLAAIDLLTEASGSLAVTGSLTAPTMDLSGTVSVQSGGRVSDTGTVFLLPGAVVAVDSQSSIEIGTAGTTTPGGILVDADGGIDGDGTLAAPVVNNATIDADAGITGGDTLEITGAVSGSGTLSLRSGTESGGGVDTSGAVLRLDGPVASSQRVSFNFSGAQNEASTLVLADPSAFTGVLDDFNNAGDTLVLPGQTITGVSVSSSAMTVLLTVGAPLIFDVGFGSAPTGSLYANGSDITVLPLRMFEWTGTIDSNFANALNWDDTTDGLDPAVVAPGTLDAASIANGGSISGSGTVYQLSFSGTNTVAGALTAINSLDEVYGTLAVTGAMTSVGGLEEESGLLTVTGTLTAASVNLSGNLSVAGGGRVITNGALELTSLPTIPIIVVDALSSIEIGTAGEATPGAITVDAAGGGIDGDGTLAAAVINNGTIEADGGGPLLGASTTMEVAGAVTGAGQFTLEAGSNGPIDFRSDAGATLRFDASVGGSQTVSFAVASSATTAPTLVLADPLAFAGTLSAFDSVGDTLILPGDTVTAASISGSTLNVSVAGGTNLTFNLANTPGDTLLTVSGDAVTVEELPRTLVWSGNSLFGFNGSYFDNASNWNDITNGLTPAASAPDALDPTEFLSGGGTITGTGTAAALTFGGPAQWLLGASSTLVAAATAGVMIGDGGLAALALTSGATITSLGSTDIVSGSSVQAASLLVDGSGSTWTSGGELVLGDTGQGSLVVQDSGTVIAGASAIVANSASASGSSISVTGTGSQLTVPGMLDVGAVGAGSVQISDGATVIAGSLDAANVAAATAQIGLTGTGTELVIANAATVADDGTGVLSVLDGATFAATSLTVGNLGDSSGAMVVSGAGSLVQLSGALNVGTALGTGDLTVGPGATVNASVVNLQGDVVLEGGFLDPTVYIENSGSTTSGFGTVGADYLVLEGTIISNGTKLNKETEVVLGTVVGGGTLAISGGTTVDGTTVNSPGILQIGTHDTIELTGAVLNAASTTFMDTQTPTGTYTVTNSVIDVLFQDSTGVLLLDDIAGFGGTVSTYHTGDSFVITGGTLSGLGVSNGDTLTFSDTGSHAGAGGIDQIIFGSGISAAGFQIVGGNTVEAVACFAAGTRIATGRGPVAVEDLRIGDHAIVADQHRENKAGAVARIAKGHPVAMSDIRCEPIVWLGERPVNCRAHPVPERVWPVRVSAGAFGENVPRRDLYLSPDHAVFINGVLVPVKLLANGTSIVQAKRDHIRYFHLELPHHAVILAEGLPVESYLDTGDRADFFGDGGTIRLWPDFSAGLTRQAALVWETRGAAPLVVAGQALDAARRLAVGHTAM